MDSSFSSLEFGTQRSNQGTVERHILRRAPRDTMLAQEGSKLAGPRAGLTPSLSGVWAVPARGPANESVSNPGHYHGGLAPASNSRGFWIISVGHIRVALSLGRFTRGTTPSNGRGRAGPE